MPGIDKECLGEGATHHLACKCREAHFALLEAKLALAREALEEIVNIVPPVGRLGYADYELRTRAREALEKLK